VAQLHERYDDDDDDDDDVTYRNLPQQEDIFQKGSPHY